MSSTATVVVVMGRALFGATFFLGLLIIGFDIDQAKELISDNTGWDPTTLEMGLSLTSVSLGVYLIDFAWRLRQITNLRPNITFDRGRGGLVLHQTKYVIEAWFKNNPRNRVAEAIARKVTARVQIFDEYDRNKMICEFPALWAESTGVDDIGFVSFSEESDITPNNTPAKLLIATKNLGEGTAYGYNVYTLRHGGDELIYEKYAIPAGIRRIHVALTGIGVEEEYELEFDNRGANKSEDFEHMSLLPRPGWFTRHFSRA